MERFTIQNTESEYAWFFTADILAHSKRKNWKIAVNINDKSKLASEQEQRKESNTETKAAVLPTYVYSKCLYIITSTC